MELSCHRCGSPVEPGALFCKQCGAPQIRVSIEPQPSSEVPPQTVQPLDGLSVRRARTPLHWAQASTATFLGGLLEALFTLFGAGIVAGGFVSVSLFRRRNPGVALSARLGARLGLISGAIGFGIFAIVRSMSLLVLHNGAAIHEAVIQQLERSAAHYATPEAQQTLQYLKTPEGWALIVAFSTIFTLIAFLLLSMLGGALGGSVLRKNNPKGF